MGTQSGTAEAELRQLVATGCRILGANGHDDYVWGHVSARSLDRRGFWMKAATFGFEEMTPEQVILVGFDGEVLEGDAPRHSEWPIHSEAMLRRPDVGSVVHTHPPHSIALAASREELRPLSHAGTMFVPPSVPVFTKTSNLIVDPTMGGEVAACLGDRDALFLINHGIVTAGGNVREAVMRAVLLEKAAHQQILALAAGGPREWPGDEEALAKRQTVWSPQHLDMLWHYLARRVEGSERGDASWLR